MKGSLRGWVGVREKLLKKRYRNRLSLLSLDTVMLRCDVQNFNSHLSTVRHSFRTKPQSRVES